MEVRPQMIVHLLELHVNTVINFSLFNICIVLYVLIVHFNINIHSRQRVDSFYASCNLVLTPSVGTMILPLKTSHFPDILVDEAL